MAQNHLSILYQEVAGDLTKCTFNLCGNREDAKDIVHDVFYLLKKKPQVLEGVPTAEQRPLLFKMTKNRFLSLYRKNQTIQKTRRNIKALHNISARYSKESDLSGSLKAAAIQEQTENETDLLRSIVERVQKEPAIDERKKEVLRLKVFGKLTHDQIANMVNCSVRTVGYDLEFLEKYLRQKYSG